MQEPQDNNGSNVRFDTDIKEIVIGGSIERSVQGQMNTAVMAMLKEAFVVCRPVRLSLGIASFVTLGIMLLILQVLSSFSAVIDQSMLMTMIQILVTPLITGLNMMGIHCALGGKIQVKQLFDPLKKSVSLIQASVLILGISLLLSTLLSLLVMDVFVQLIITGIVQLLLGFVYPLIFEKHMTPIVAIRNSFQVSWRYIHKIIVCNMLAAMLAIIGLLPALNAIQSASSSPIAYIASFLFLIFIAAPYYFVINGILYRELFGIKILVSNKTQGFGIMNA